MSEILHVGSDVAPWPKFSDTQNVKGGMDAPELHSGGMKEVTRRQ